MVVPSSEKILDLADEVLTSEDIENSKFIKTREEKLNDFILPGLKNSKDTLNVIYRFRTRDRSGILGKLKSKIQNKLVNIVINVIEHQSMKQQKFNELTYIAISELVEENKELKKQLTQKN